MKGMMLCTPACCRLTYMNYAWTALSHPYMFTAERGTRSKQFLRVIRALESVSWPQKGCCDYISQKLLLLVVQHHGV